MTKSITKTLLHLLKDFKSTEYVTEIDFIQKCINDNRFSSEDIIIDYFLKLRQCEEFLEKVAKDFIHFQCLRRVSEEYIKILIFFLVFVLDSKNAQEILENTMFYTTSLLNYLCREEKYPTFAKWASQYFDNQFVINNIFTPLYSRVEAFKAIVRFIEQEERKKIPVNKLTIPKPFNLSTSYMSPPPPANTPDMRKSNADVRIKERKIKHITYEDIQKKLQEEHKKHVINAAKLLSQVKTLKVPKCKLSNTTTEITEKSVVQTKKVTPTKLPPKKDVEVKQNVATTLRDAARLIKEQEEEINRIQDILKGGQGSIQLEATLAEERKSKELKEWQTIQKRHLEGLITFEEAVLAKKKLLQENRVKFLEVQAEKIHLNQMLDEFKEKEFERAKAQVERTHKEKEEAKEIEKKYLEKKIEDARLMDYEIKEKLKQKEKEKAAELACKIDLISQLKSLHEINVKMNEAKKEFDPTGTANLGLLCEMSIAELRERLAVEKMKIYEDLEEKRRKVQVHKRQQQEMLNRYKEFIDNSRKNSKIALEPTSKPVELTENAELVNLRKVLEQKRSLRSSM
ncbi:unnamed protein product [Phyllotreta striolata]|uniref:Cilia- and flagella-associated protein 99 n=1 Tax=Phyllotreta striolata TaxID=444603 RepID=A0A9N9TEN9_PHYSR|nr:unnamed protein product [Phyllotreta striolata]